MDDAAKEITKFIKENPFLFTEHKVLDAEYLAHFKNRYDCIYNFRIPFYIDPRIFVNDHKEKVVQTFHTIIAGTVGSSIITVSIFQFDVRNHCSVAYHLNDDKLVASVGIYVSDPKMYLEFINLFERYQIKDEKKVVGFGGFAHGR